MNKTYRSIWNASLGCYVAAPECAAAHTAGTSRQRASRAAPLMRSKSALVLEARVLFDGAMVATAIEIDSGADAPVIDDAPEVEEVEIAEADAMTEAPADVPAATADEAVSDEVPSADADTDAGTDAPTVAAADPDDTDLAIAPEAPARTEVVFVDGRVNDPSAFEGEGREVVVLSLDQDGMAQIASALSGRTGLSAIHIVSHGGDGYLSLGSGDITADTLQSTNLSSLQLIGQALSEDGDILIYACDYAAGAAGLEAMDLIADITGADVAASADATGHESLGGDWTLEQSTGDIDTAALAPQGWIHALDFSFTPASSAGAIGMAQTIMGAGVTVVSATYQGGGTQAGTFAAGSGVTFGSNVLDFTSGALLSTSNNAALVSGPNSNAGFGENATAGIDGNAELNTLAGGFNTFDAAILDITFVPDVPAGAQVGDVARMTIEVVFGSEEYLEYVNGGYNDVMAVVVNGVNQALVPNTSGGESAISIDSVNNVQNQSLFVNNTSGTYSTQMDGFTRTIPLVFDVIVGQQNNIRLAVADTGDAAYDSWMFIRADSAQTVVVAEDDEVTTAANLPITVDLTANDYNLAGANLTLSQIQGQAVSQGQVITLGSGVQLTVGSGGQVTVTGNGSSAVTDTFTYQVSNGLGGVATATVNVSITAPNFNPPVAQDDVEGVQANASLSDSVLTDNGNGADTDPNGNPLSVVQVNLSGFTAGSPITLPSGALLTMNANGTYVYDPNGAFDGLASGATTTDSFSYTVSDGQGGNDTASVSVTITGVNDAPVAADDSVTVSEEGVALLADPRANDSDPDGDALELVLTSTTGSNGGMLSADDSGGLVFIAGASFDDLAVGQTRDTTFTYTVTDTAGATDTATITVTVQGANDAPVAVDDAYDVTGDDAYALDSPLTNDTDPDGSQLVFSLNTMAGSNGGTFSTDDSGGLIFIAGNDFLDLAVGQSRQTQVTYTASDEYGATSAATVTVTVHGVNNGPVGGNNDFYAYEDNALSLGSVLADDTDVDGGDLYIESSGVYAGDNGGEFYFDDSSSLTFNPGGDFNDLAEGETRITRFQYTVFDGQGGSAVAQVTMTVMGLNDQPLAVDDSVTGLEDIDTVIGGLLGNDADADGQLLSLLAGEGDGSGGGHFTVDGELNIVFDPDGDFEDLQEGQTRDTSFTYSISDGHGGSSQAIVTVSVAGANDNPVAQGEQFDADNQTAVSLGGLVANDSDVDGDELVVVPFSTSTGSAGGTFSIDDGGSLSFDPAGDFDDLAVGDTRDTVFFYSVSDGHGGTAEASVTVTVHGVAPAEAEGDGDNGDGPPPSYPNDVVFVDARVPDPQAFATGGRELIVLNLQDDGLAQIAAALAGRSGVEAVHIVSHGGDGYLTLGNGEVDADSIQTYQLASLQALAQALSADGDILIYACDFAAGSEGQNVLQLMAQYTVADVAASMDTTGHSTLGGDFVLEVTVGSVEAQTIAPVGWIYTLSLPGSDVAAPVTAEAPSNQADPQPTAPHRVPQLAMAAAPAAAAPVQALEVAGTERLVSLEAVFRQSVSPFLGASVGSFAPAADGVAPVAWAAPVVEVDTHPSEPQAWLPTVETLDDSLVDEAVANAVVSDADPADALALPRQQAAPGFAAQLARWSQWSTQRPLTRAVARI